MPQAERPACRSAPRVLPPSSRHQPPPPDRFPSSPGAGENGGLAELPILVGGPVAAGELEEKRCRSAPKAVLGPEIAPAPFNLRPGPERSAPEKGGPEGRESRKGRVSRARRGPSQREREAGPRQTNRKRSAAGLAGGVWGPQPRLQGCGQAEGRRAGTESEPFRLRSQPGTRGVLTGRDPESRSSGERADGTPRAGRAPGTAPRVEHRFSRLLCTGSSCCPPPSPGLFLPQPCCNSDLSS
ncbi:translation initiation factor IF-2-like [Mustela erminea]|uniref:translation initiation factor IF-2-like n=1 Tax=Mustela erminea TaxID=36723 RepID=UPI0013868FA9|nr:translation initiation factor IF-2-like [Mustela erminea]